MLLPATKTICPGLAEKRELEQQKNDVGEVFAKRNGKASENKHARSYQQWNKTASSLCHVFLIPTIIMYKWRYRPLTVAGGCKRII